MTTLVQRLASVQVSSLCDADKSLPVVDPEIHALLPGTRLAGPAYTVVARDDHLPILVALRRAQPGSVLVVATDGHRRAVAGELLATEARRRGLAGIVVDGYCRDLAGLRTTGLPVYARGTNPMSGTALDSGTLGGRVRVGGVDVAAGHVVVGDEDGLVIAPAERLVAAIGAAEEIERAERALLDGMAGGRSLHEMTNIDEHLSELSAYRSSTLRFTV